MKSLISHALRAAPSAPVGWNQAGAALVIGRHNWGIAGAILALGAVVISTAIAGDESATSGRVPVLIEELSAEAQAELNAVATAQIEDLLDPMKNGSWGKVLNAGNYGDGHAEDMAKFYAANATLLPTVSAGLWTAGAMVKGACPAEPEKRIANYFKCKFLPGKPQLLSVDAKHVVLLGSSYIARDGQVFREKDFASYQGLYTFQVDDGKGGRKAVKARFTFVYETPAEEGKRWSPEHTKIVMHHSSAEPEGKKACRGDVNNDGKVNYLDIIEVLSNWQLLCPIP